jgi:hypothetical protein
MMRNDQVDASLGGIMDNFSRYIDCHQDGSNI